MPTAPKRGQSVGRLFAAGLVIVMLALIAGYIWSVVNGEAAVVTAASAIIVFAVGEAFTRRRVANQHRWDKIAPSYENFIRLVRDLAEAGDERDSEQVEKKSAEVLAEFSDQLLLWGGPPVIEAWAAAMRLGATDPPGHEMVLAYAKVLLAIRKDLGHSDLTLDARDLLRVTIKDIDEYLSPGTRL